VHRNVIQEPDLEIAGVFLVAGNEIPKEFQEVDDFEQWEWVQADASDTAQRQVIARVCSYTYMRIRLCVYTCIRRHLLTL
jgi:hypothetical protein